MKAALKQIEKGEELEYEFTEGVLCQKGRIYVPAHKQLQVEVMAHYHDHKL